MLAADLDDTIGHLQPGNAFEQAEVDVLTECEHQRVGFDGFELAGRLRKALAVEGHLFDGQRGFVACLMVDSHLTMMPSCSASSSSKSCAGILSRVRR
jgi:hypothetical protein